jgi:hypothetical protein
MTIVPAPNPVRVLKTRKLNYSPEKVFAKYIAGLIPERKFARLAPAVPLAFIDI